MRENFKIINFKAKENYFMDNPKKIKVKNKWMKD